MKLNLQTNNQSFAIFDVIMSVMAFFAIVLAIAGLFTGGYFLWLAGFMLVCLFLLAEGVFIEPKRLKITRLRRPLVKNPKVWLKAVFIADLHAGSNKSKSWYDGMWNKIKQLGPELLLIGGDCVVGDPKFIDKLDGLEKVSPRLGKYFVLGNHDYLDDPQAVKEQVEAWGCEDLTNKSHGIKFQGQDLRLVGMDETLFGKPDFNFVRDPSVPTVCLSHQADNLLDMKEGQADLVLCGHAHGGQIRFPLIGSVVVPSKLKKADMGFRVINGLPTFITTGIGEVLIRARLFCPPEIVVLELGL
ncbi:MAG: metallophosphoesterase [Patescibacteria group bacterium]|nr:metallophosphoesterase [Patescibacteria group bacterium]